MNLSHRTTCWLLAVLMTGWFAGWASAQDAAKSKPIPPPENPAVLAVLETDPSTPAELARAAAILAGLDKPELAKGFLKRILDAKLTPAQWVELAEQCDVSKLTEMASRKPLLPEAKLVADAVVEAVARQKQEPDRIAQLIEQLRDPSPQKQDAAHFGLLEARQAAIGPLAAVLADPARSAEQTAVRAVLVGMGRDAVKPLLAILETADPQLATQAILVLGRMKAPDVPFYLLRPYLSARSDPTVRAAAGAELIRLTGGKPTYQEAVRLLTEKSKAYFDLGQPVAGVIDGKVDVWSWDDKARRCAARSISAEDAARLTAARFARDAYDLAEEDRHIRLLYLTTMLEAAAYRQGLDKPLAEAHPAVAEAARFDDDAIESVLHEAMAGDHPVAATAAAQILGRRATAAERLYRGSHPSPLARAAGHADRRLRMAALAAIVGLKPAKPFPGSSCVLRSLGFFAASSGVPRALVAGPSTAKSRELAGMLETLGYKTDVATTGRELVRLATTSPDYELALIDTATEHPTVGILVQQLRHDDRSADLRVGLTARSGHLERARQIADREGMTMAFSRAHDLDALRWQVDRLATLQPRRFVDRSERRRQASDALDLLAELSRAPGALFAVRGVEDALLTALYAPKLGAKAAGVLGQFGTPKSQRALVEVASRWSQPLEVRKAAVAALGHSIQAHGVLLTSGEIRRQYERYNQSEDLDVETQQILGQVLDYLEAPTAAVKPSPQAKPHEKAAPPEPTAPVDR